MAGHIVGNQRRGDVIVLQLPNRQARALQEWPRLIGEHIDLFPGSHGRADHPERGAITCRCQRARIAVGEHGFAVGNQHRAIPTDTFVDRNVFQADL